MKYILFFCCFCYQLIAQDAADLSRLYEYKIFNALEQKNQDPKHAHYYFYKAVFANVCNKAQLSQSYLDTLVQQGLPADISYDYHVLRNDNCTKLFDYNNALFWSKVLIEQFDSTLGSEGMKDIQNSSNIWACAKDEKPQYIEPFGHCSIPYKRDKAGLVAIKINANNIDTNFLFDTGAGLCSITESMAKALNFKFLPKMDIKVQGFTGIYNEVRIAIAPRLRIGGINIENLLFLVFKDEALTFLNGQYKVNGIIGLPVAKELGTIVYTKDSLSFFGSPPHRKTAEKNLFIEFLHPILILKYQDDFLPFTFDTGASSTLFSCHFYNRYKKLLKGKNKVERSASAGGFRAYATLVVPQLDMLLGEKNLAFKQLSIDKKHPNPLGAYLYGNIGLDVFRHYSKVIISFDGNYLDVE